MDGNSAEKPKMKGNLDDLAQIAADKSVEDVKNIEVNSDVTAEVGQTWKVKVPEAEMTKSSEIDVVKFSTKTTMEVPSGWSHYLKADTKESQDGAKKDAVSETTKEKKERQPKKAKTTPDPAVPGVKAKAKPNKAEKELGGAKKDEKSEDLKEPETPEQRHQKAKEMALKRQAERGASAENLQEFGEVYDKWREAIVRSDKVEKEFNAEYEKFLGNESLGWRKFANIPRRMFGFRPKMTGNILALQQQSEQARGDYFEAAKRLKDLKMSHTTYGRGQKVVERYQPQLAHKLVVGVHQNRVAIQEKVAIEAEKLSRIRPVLETMRKYRYVRWGATALGYAAIAGATGGVGAAALAGGAYGARLVGAMAFGSAAGSLQRVVGSRFEKRTVVALAKGESEVKSDFFNRGFTASEAEIDSLARHVEEVRGLNKTMAVGHAIGAGFVGGAAVGDSFDALTPDVPSTPYTPSPVPNGEGGGTPHVEKPTIPDSKSPVNPPATADTAPKVPNESSPKVEDVPRVVPEENTPTTPETKPSTPEQTEPTPPSEEVIPESPEVFHKVVSGENAWNIMEGRGPDAHPVGGKSVFLQDKNLPVGERQALLDKAIDYLEKNPEAAKEIGAVKSDGNIHKIYPGEVLNISKFDDLLRNIYEGNDPAGAAEAPLNEEFYEDLGTDEEPHEPEDAVTDMNNVTLSEMFALSKGISVSDPDALARLGELGWNVDDFTDMISTLRKFGGDEAINLDTTTVGDFLNNSKKVFDNSTPGEETTIPKTTPYGRTPEGKPYGDYHLLYEGQEVKNASLSPEAATETTGQSLNSFVRGIEQPRNGIFDTLFGMGKPNIAGTFDQMKDLSMGQLREMVANDELPAAVSDDEAFDRWMEVVKNVPADDGETFAAVVDRVANSRIA